MGAQLDGQPWADPHGPGPFAFGRARVIAAAWLLAVDLHRPAVEVNVGPGEGECFGDASAGANEQFGEWAVVRGAGVEVAVDLSETEVVELVVLDW